MGGGTAWKRQWPQRFMGLSVRSILWSACRRLCSRILATREDGAAIRALPCDVRKADAVDTMIDTIWKDGPLMDLEITPPEIFARTENLSVRLLRGSDGSSDGDHRCDAGMWEALVVIIAPSDRVLDISEPTHRQVRRTSSHPQPRKLEWKPLCEALQWSWQRGIV